MASKSIKFSDVKRTSKPRSDTIAEFKDELKKVTWTSKDELRSFSKIVVIATFVFGMGTYLADLVIRGALDGLSLVVRAIWG